MRRMRVLLFEYVHSDAEMYVASSEGMRREGRAMLLGLYADLAAIPNVSVDVACCNEAVAEISKRVTSPTILSSSGGVEHVLCGICALAADCDVVIPIVPECDDLLVTVVSRLRADGHHVVAPGNETIATCSDKWATFKKLGEHNLPAIPTCRADALPPDVLSRSELFVVKPRDGAGCGGIRRLPRNELMESPEVTENGPSTIVQPFVEGNAFSVGIIGRGKQSPLIMPLARQLIEWNNNRPHYRGGEILYSAEHHFAEQAKRIGQAISDAFELREGYVGVDLLRPTDSNELLVTEINPRFCSSYVGYRHAASSNLAEVLLRFGMSQDDVWKTEDTLFSF